MGNMKRVGLVISIFMCATLSLCLPIIGVIQSGSFSLPMYLLNFVIGFLVSFLISMMLPTIRINMALERKFGLKCNKLKARLLETFLSDLIYTPLITIFMTSIAWYNLKKMGAETPPYIPMILSSLAISFVVAYIIIFFALPLYLKIAMKICDVEIPKERPKDLDKE